MTSHATAARTSDELEDDRPIVGRRVVWGLASGGSSMAVHLALLLIFGLMATPVVPQPPKIVCGFELEERQPAEVIPVRLPESAKPAESMNFAPSGPRRRGEIPPAAPHDPIASPQLGQVEVAHKQSLNIDVGENRVFAHTGKSLSTAVPDGASGEAIAAVGDYGEALDRLTQEILNRLAQRKLLVVWLFDESESMQDDRAEIAARVRRVYDELKLSDAAKDDALATGVMSFGANVHLHTAKPTHDRNVVEAAIAAVPNDPSGKEMMCRALSGAITQHQRFAELSGRQMMCILVTDESGDMATNISELEPTIALARAARCPVYVLGREAVFGYPFAHLRWIDPATQIGFWLRIDRGPESPQPEQLQVDGIHRRYDAHPSGFGPYEQARLARQTGGVFFLLPSPETNLVRRDDRRYDPDSMRPYLPDLSARSDYALERGKYPLRTALWQVITDLNPYHAHLADVVQVRLWDWPIEREAFAREAERNIRKAGQLGEYFATARRALEKVRPQRDRDPSLRWRANFDVAYAQTIAYQARLREYSAYVAAFVGNPKPIRNVLGPARPTNAWDGAYVTRTLVNDAETKQLRDTATRLFREVAAEHSGTPWAARAEYELSRGFGVELREDYEDPRRGTVRVPEQ